MRYHFVEITFSLIIRTVTINGQIWFDMVSGRICSTVHAENALQI